MPKSVTPNPAQLVGYLARDLSNSDTELYVQAIRQGFDPEEWLRDPNQARGIPLLSLKLRTRSSVEGAGADVSRALHKGYGVTAVGEGTYPRGILNLASPPPLLFYLGDIAAIQNPEHALAIVGSRQSDRFGEELAKSFARTLADIGLTIVSGLAIGIDGAAHTGALQSKHPNPTVAVLGNGLDSIYPPRHRDLHAQILKQGGLVLSQFSPEEPAYPGNFLDRNRLLAGLSRAVLVIQAAKRSGSLATARYALESGREVLAIPGAVNDLRYTGSNQLLRQGAHLITSAAEVLEHFPELQEKIKVEKSAEQVSDPELSNDEVSLIKKLKRVGEIDYDNLIGLAPDPSKLAGIILDLELRGILERRPGNLVGLVA